MLGGWQLSWEGTGCGWVADQRKECTVGRYGSGWQDPEVGTRTQGETSLVRSVSKGAQDLSSRRTQEQGKEYTFSSDEMRPTSSDLIAFVLGKETTSYNAMVVGRCLEILKSGQDRDCSTPKPQARLGSTSL